MLGETFFGNMERQAMGPKDNIQQRLDCAGKLDSENSLYNTVKFKSENSIAPVLSVSF